MDDLIFWIGAFDAVVIAALGAAGAAIKLSGKEADVFFKRILPACGILVATSIAAGVVMSLTRWLIG